jgi:hypothetical protein
MTNQIIEQDNKKGIKSNVEPNEDVSPRKNFNRLNHNKNRSLPSPTIKTDNSRVKQWLNEHDERENNKLKSVELLNGKRDQQNNTIRRRLSLSEDGIKTKPKTNTTNRFRF